MFFIDFYFVRKNMWWSFAVYKQVKQQIMQRLLQCRDTSDGLLGNEGCPKGSFFGVFVMFWTSKSSSMRSMRRSSFAAFGRVAVNTWGRETQEGSWYLVAGRQSLVDGCWFSNIFSILSPEKLTRSSWVSHLWSQAMTKITPERLRPWSSVFQILSDKSCCAEVCLDWKKAVKEGKERPGTVLVVFGRRTTPNTFATWWNTRYTPSYYTSQYLERYVKGVKGGFTTSDCTTHKPSWNPDHSGWNSRCVVWRGYTRPQNRQVRQHAGNKHFIRSFLLMLQNHAKPIVPSHIDILIFFCSSRCCGDSEPS